MKRTRYVLALLAFVGLGLLAACGSDNNDNANLFNCAQTDVNGNCISNNINGSCQFINGLCQSTIAGVQCIQSGNSCVQNNNNNNSCLFNPALCNGNYNGGAHGGLCVLDNVGNCRSTRPDIGFCYNDYYSGRCRFQSRKATN